MFQVVVYGISKFLGAVQASKSPQDNQTSHCCTSIALPQGLPGNISVNSVEFTGYYIATSNRIILLYFLWFRDVLFRNGSFRGADFRIGLLSRAAGAHYCIIAVNPVPSALANDVQQGIKFVKFCAQVTATVLLVVPQRRF